MAMAWHCVGGSWCCVAATQLKPDVGTPELPAGRVRVRRDADGSITEVDEDSVQRVSHTRFQRVFGVYLVGHGPGWLWCWQREGDGTVLCPTAAL